MSRHRHSLDLLDDAAAAGVKDIHGARAGVGDQQILAGKRHGVETRTPGDFNDSNLLELRRRSHAQQQQH